MYVPNGILAKEYVVAVTPVVVLLNVFETLKVAPGVLLFQLTVTVEP